VGRGVAGSGAAYPVRRTYICSVSQTPCSVGPNGCGYCIGVPCRWPRSNKEAIAELEAQAKDIALARVRLLTESDLRNANLACHGSNAGGVAQSRRIPLYIALASLRRVRSTLGLANSKQIKQYASIIQQVMRERGLAG
jgi:hypothetical protein